jgi:hypothetical protein
MQIQARLEGAEGKILPASLQSLAKPSERYRLMRSHQESMCFHSRGDNGLRDKLITRGYPRLAFEWEVRKVGAGGSRIIARGSGWYR